MFEEDEIVYMDRGTCNECLVTIIKFLKSKPGYCSIKDACDQVYSVNILRLTKI